jgi:hypothetical protein
MAHRFQQSMDNFVLLLYITMAVTASSAVAFILTEIFQCSFVVFVIHFLATDNLGRFLTFGIVSIQMPKAIARTYYSFRWLQES